MGFTRNTTYYTGIVYEWNLPTGWTCPFADECLVKVDRKTGKMDNRSGKYRCYAAAAERFPSARKSRWGNFDASKDGEITELPKAATDVRVHSSGDFFSQDYFDAWLAYAAARPEINFWAFTKSIGYWVNRINAMPPNLTMTASYGGRQDDLIEKHGLRFALVVDSVVEAARLGLPVDTNDDLARANGGSFALVNSQRKKRCTNCDPLADPNGSWYCAKAACRRALLQKNRSQK